MHAHEPTSSDHSSVDRGDSWQQIDAVAGVFLYTLEVAGDKLFAARTDGLWSTPLATTAVAPASLSAFKRRFRR
jgi:hypothetical protein